MRISSWGKRTSFKTAEDLYEIVVNTVPGAKLGVAFCEASGQFAQPGAGLLRGVRDLLLDDQSSRSIFGANGARPRNSGRCRRQFSEGRRRLG